jgi:hypothetical protein
MLASHIFADLSRTRLAISVPGHQGASEDLAFKPMNPVGLVGGAVLFWGGMALTGYCPGTVAVAAGSGRRDQLDQLELGP